MHKLLDLIGVETPKGEDKDETKDWIARQNNRVTVPKISTFHISVHFFLSISR